jgi:hypothetical protein
MAGPDASAIAALRSYTTPVNADLLRLLDIVGDPIRVTTAPYSIAFTGTGDADLDGFTFSAVDPEFISVSPVTMKEGGADTVTCTLSGLIGVDTDAAQPDRQQGQLAGPRGPAVAAADQRGADAGRRDLAVVHRLHDGAEDRWRQDQPDDPARYRELSVLHPRASGRSYLNQADYDSGDLSAAASIACANGTTAAGRRSPGRPALGQQRGIAITGGMPDDALPDWESGSRPIWSRCATALPLGRNDCAIFAAARSRR